MLQTRNVIDVAQKANIWNNFCHFAVHIIIIDECWMPHRINKFYHTKYVTTMFIHLTSGAKQCQFCLTEKLINLHYDPETTFNKRSKLISRWRHKNKFKLSMLLVTSFCNRINVALLFIFVQLEPYYTAAKLVFHR